MARAEEAGQQPTRPVPARAGSGARRPQQHDPQDRQAPGQPGTSAMARPAWPAVSEKAVEALEQEIGKEDLADPGDPAELARVENARRRLGA